MGKLIVVGGQKLSGDLIVEGAKNSVLPILAATILNGGINIIKNCPELKDVEIMIEILKELGCKVNIEGNTVIIDSSCINNTVVSEELAAEMRSSIIFLGPIISRFGKATISYPGDCAILLAGDGSQLSCVKAGKCARGKGTFLCLCRSSFLRSVPLFILAAICPKYHLSIF